ncbi:hypothetical protein [Asticcacaulis sp.]|uniref:hypothetical protein n=1 Tax=Asticcacaulis sp. TaxID=1872648 RepID=UPI0031D4690C
MLNLKKLAVSLTKHGAHKLAVLLQEVPLDEILASTTGVVDGVNIDAGQVRKLLSANKAGGIPPLWRSIQSSDLFVIRAMVLMAIVFSHHEIIEQMAAGSGGAGQGQLLREQFSNPKSFTNLKNDFESLGFMTFANYAGFGFDLRPIFLHESTGRLSAQLLGLKLRDAGWVGGDVVSASLEAGFAGVLGLTENEFKKWLSGTNLSLEEKIEVGVADPDKEKSSPFLFKPGHNPKKSGRIKRKERIAAKFASLLHNEIQNTLYIWLENVYGVGSISSENSTGAGDTAIDIVRDTGGGFVFYEIKTARSIKACIREALPQLMEYSYWPDAQRAVELIIVSPNKPTEDAASYLKRLREEFKIPVFHETVDLETGRLSEKI